MAQDVCAGVPHSGEGMYAYQIWTKMEKLFEVRRRNNKWKWVLTRCIKGAAGKRLGFFIFADKVGGDSWTRLVFSDMEERLVHSTNSQNCHWNAHAAKLLLWTISPCLGRDEAEFPLKFVSSPLQLCRLTPETFHSSVRWSLPSSGSVAQLSCEAEYLSR